MTRVILQSQDQLDAAIAHHKAWQGAQMKDLLPVFGSGIVLLIFGEFVKDGPFELPFIVAVVVWGLYLLYTAFSSFRDEHLHRREAGLQCGHCDKTFYIGCCKLCFKDGFVPKMPK